ncbi:MAG: hypothetical protein II837_16460 [Treponema sp.]|nr:hypothetical protein [Treponema sp.]
MEENNDEERRKLLLSKIAKFRLFDDDFMSKVFEDDIEATEFLLRTILQRDDLEVTESKGQAVRHRSPAGGQGGRGKAGALLQRDTGRERPPAGAGL